MTTITFRRLIQTAILPEKEKLAKPELLDREARWIKNRRVKGVCWPYRSAKELGWTLYSPVDVAIHPLSEIQTTMDKPEEFARLKQLTDMDEWVQKDDILLGVKPSSWYKIHEYEYEGRYRSMFIPNGEGTLEWRLGWSVDIPDDHLLLIQPIEMKDARFIVHPGLLMGTSVQSVQRHLGLPIAFEPLQPCKIIRGEPLAKLFVLPKSVLAIKSTTQS
ncbi:hypothetical protein [Cohnella sp.]|uniref:hypothetical protein n=1 Tax=Cohnella sp. TaxID=1883426 RepID=UPI00370399B6